MNQTTCRLAYGLLASALSLAACAPAPVATGREVLTLAVASEQRECTGLIVQQCLLVKQSPSREWQLFYDSIEGFDYEPGFNYTLRVERKRIHDPPQDASAYEWKLIEVLQKVPA